MEGVKEFEVVQGTRAVGGSTETSVEEWIGFLTEGSRYDKTIRTKEEARTLDKPIVLYPDPSDIHKFYAFSHDKDIVISLEYKEKILKELNTYDPAFRMLEPNQAIFLSELKKALGLPTQGGGRRRSRRRSRKAKANKAHTPQ